MLLLFGVLVLTFQSCEVNGIDSQGESLRIDLAKIENLKNLDENSQRIAFRLLTMKRNIHLECSLLTTSLQIVTSTKNK